MKISIKNIVNAVVKRTAKVLVVLFAAMATISLISCEKDKKSDFEGKDDHIVSFALTAQSGVKYVAQIKGKDILITVPTTENLIDAKAEVALCENSRLLPDPATIKDWESEQVFRVESYNGTYTAYTYMIQKSAVVQDGTVTLQTQKEVDAFGAKKINVIDGNFILGSNDMDEKDPITSLEPLESLTEIGLNVIVRNNVRFVTFSALKNLKSIGGLCVGTAMVMANLGNKIELSIPELTSATNIVINTDSIADIRLPKLKSVGTFNVNTRLPREIDLSALEIVNGDFYLSAVRGGLYSEEASNLSLNNLQLDKLKEVSGNFSIENFWNIREVKFKKLDRVGGDFEIKYIRNTSAVTLPVLKTVGGAFNISCNDKAVKLDAPLLESCGSFNVASINNYSINLVNMNLPKLEKCNGNFTIKFFGGEVIDLPSLKSIKGKIDFTNIQFVERINTPVLSECGEIALSALLSVAELDFSKCPLSPKVAISNCPALKKLGLPKEITDVLKFTGNAKQTFFPQLFGVEKVGSSVQASSFNCDVNLGSIKDAAYITMPFANNVTGLEMPNLEAVKTINVGNAGKMTVFKAPKLKECTTFMFKGGVLVEDLDFSSLEKVDAFTYYGATSAAKAKDCILTNMNTFSNLKTAKKIDVRYCGNLADFSGFKNVIGSLSGNSNWTVMGCAYNPTLQDMIDGKYTE